ncbi:hypothetical protein EIP91_005392 [Steccherinum ochraceum]|uniref:Uncharacterized protein n=1 Tax=Steccherinum ochraceum TaxID=92696 RepID=A0A4R0R770_9APHY|nr:hypothetical protein EIP91_005392 [Steccherinum ochraceum]
MPGRTKRTKRGQGAGPPVARGRGDQGAQAGNATEDDGRPNWEDIYGPPIIMNSNMTPEERADANRRLAMLGVYVDREDDDDDKIDAGNPGIVAARRRLPTLPPLRGPPVHFHGIVGGVRPSNPYSDSRLVSMSMGFPVSVHPLRLPNTRAQITSGVSVIDYNFLRIAGLIHKMTPVRADVDNVELTKSGDQTKVLQVYGRVVVTFDAEGYEFEHKFWVIDMGLPLEMQLSEEDFCLKFGCVTDTQDGAKVIRKADAKVGRKIEDVYVVEQVGPVI